MLPLPAVALLVMSVDGPIDLPDARPYTGGWLHVPTASTRTVARRIEARVGELPPCRRAEAVGRKLGPSYDIRATAWLGNDRALAVGALGAVLTSRDGGKSWTPLARFSSATLRDVVFVDERHAFIAGDRDGKGRSLWESRDGGATWRAVADDLPDLARLLLTPAQVLLVTDGGAVFARSRAL